MSPYFEDFTVGDVHYHEPGRTVTTTDNIWFTLLTQNTAKLHLDHQYAAATPFGRPLVNSTFTLAARPSASRPEAGVLTVATEGYNQDGVVVISFRRTLLVYRRDSAPRPTVTPPPEEWTC